jgi:hypothetical protein
MKKVLLIITILAITLLTLSVLPKSHTDAETLCPSNMDPNSRECL